MPFFLLPSSRGVTRREFLSGLAGATAAGVMAQGSFAATSNAPPWYALISDTHIAADANAVARGQCMAENLRAVVADVVDQEPSPLGAIIDGDLALADGQSGDYRTFLKILDPLRRANIPLYLGLGNHDDRAHFRDVFGMKPPEDTDVVDKHVGILEGPSTRIVILDSLTQANVTPGLLGDRQRRWLAQALDADKRTPTWIFVHHNLSATEPNALTDTEAFLAVIQPRRQVKAVVYGHTHQWARREQDGLQIINLPAVAYPFTNDQPLGWCRMTPTTDGAELQLRCVGGVRKDDKQVVSLRWRPT
jgi:3',5'-cyclic-AMP phosphodiesterase